MGAREDALRGATGQDHDGGGAPFAPGVHIVKIRKVACFVGNKDKQVKFVVESVVLKSLGGSLTLEMVNGKAENLPVVKTGEPMPFGTVTAWIQSKKHDVFDSRVGNFNAAAKKVLAADWADLDAAQREEWLDTLVKASPTPGPGAKAQLKNFFDVSCAKSPNATIGDDLIDIADHGLAVDLYMRAKCSQTTTRARDKVLVDTVWEPLTESEYAEALALDPDADSGE